MESKNKVRMSFLLAQEFARMKEARVIDSFLQRNDKGKWKLTTCLKLPTLRIGKLTLWQ